MTQPVAQVDLIKAVAMLSRHPQAHLFSLETKILIPDPGGSALLERSPTVPLSVFGVPSL